MLSEVNLEKAKVLAIELAEERAESLCDVILPDAIASTVAEYGGGHYGASKKLYEGIKAGEEWANEFVPYGDLSGEWADGMTPNILMSYAGLAEDINHDELDDEVIIDAYENAFLEKAISYMTEYLKNAIEGEIQNG